MQQYDIESRAEQLADLFEKNGDLFQWEWAELCRPELRKCFEKKVDQLLSQREPLRLCA